MGRTQSMHRQPLLTQRGDRRAAREHRCPTCSRLQCRRPADGSMITNTGAFFLVCFLAPQHSPPLEHQLRTTGSTGGGHGGREGSCCAGLVLSAPRNRRAHHSRWHLAIKSEHTLDGRDGHGNSLPRQRRHPGNHGNPPPPPSPPPYTVTSQVWNHDPDKGPKQST